MKILVSITTYHKDKEEYVSQLIKEYEKICDEINCTIDIVICKNYDANFIYKNKIVINLSEYKGENHCWANKEFIYKNYENYDYIIESDDDVLISKQNILQYVKYESLSLDLIPGFIITEEDKENRVYIHSMLFNSPPVFSENFRLNNNNWFVPENIHAACFMIDKKRMNLFLKNTDGKIKNMYSYDVQCTARSEIYNFFKKIINLDEMDSHIVKHLTNKYLYTSIVPISEYRTVDFWKDHINSLLKQ